MDTTAIDAKVRALPLLDGMDASAKPLVAAAIRGVSNVLRYDEDDTLIQEGHLSFGTGYLLVDGAVSIELDPNPVDLTAPALLGEMAQFKAMDLRNANVRAKNEVTALQFYWDDLYESAAKTLPPEAMTQFRDALERQVWERFPYKNIVDLPLFGDLTLDLKSRVCRPFTSISERIALKPVEALFNQGAKCKMTGFLLVGGKLRLMRRHEHELILAAPNILGIFPGKNENGKEWTATAMAEGDAEVLKFSWERYTRELTSRFSRDEQNQIIGSFKNNAKKHFWH